MAKVNKNIENVYPLSPLQEGMLFHYLSDRNTTAYILQSLYNIKENFDTEKIKQALALLSQRFSVLRTMFVYEKMKDIYQIVLKERELGYEYIDLSDRSEAYAENVIKEVVEADLNKGFDLKKDPLFRITHVKVGEKKDKMLLSYHHIIVDGWCNTIMLEKLFEYYESLCSGRSFDDLLGAVNEEKASSSDYSDYIKWLIKQDKNKAREFWRELLDGYDSDCSIKPAFKAEKNDENVCNTTHMISRETTALLKNIAESNQCTINSAAEAAVGILLQTYSHSDDVVFGKVISGRNAPVYGIEKIVGLFINTIPVRVTTDASATVVSLMRSQQEQSINSTNYDYFSLAEIQSMTSQGSGLINILYVFENYMSGDIQGKEEKNIIDVESERDQTNYPISILAFENDGRLGFKIIYDSDIFCRREIENILSRIEKICEEMASHPDSRISELEVVTDSEKQLILGKFNATETNYQRDKTVVELFEEQVNRTPNNTALVFENNTLTYAELNAKANSLAHKLRELGVKPDDFVAIIADRSIEMICGIYGIIKSGGAYVPIDPTYPAERISFMLDDCKPKAVLKYTTENVIIDNEIPVIDLTDSKVWTGAPNDLQHINTPNDLIYCIYTSGTTGKPKGVMIEHHGVVAMQDYLVKLYNVTEKDNVLQFANYIFDASVWEMTLALYCGAALVLISSEKIADTIEFENYIKEKNVTLTLLPPQYFRQIETDCFRILTTGGSASNSDVVKHVKDNCKYINAYGPTENTVLATHWEHEKGTDIPEIIPIGKPIFNSKIYILNGESLCGIGVPGELCITGDGLARGYLNRPELTAEKFVKNPFGEGRMYRSGDLARWLPDGNIEFLGRIDEQVKIRGFRIELGEIESRIREIEGIKDCAVIARADSTGDKAIYAYYTSDEEKSVSEIRDRLSESMPEYMVPAYMMQIKAIPVTRNGKLDKRALPEIEAKATKEYIAPRNEVEEKICNIFSEILNVEQVGIKDSFFELGGHSLRATRLVNRIEAETGTRIALKEVFAHPTAEQLAVLAGAESEEYLPIPKAEEKEYYPMSSAQKRTYLIQQMDPESTAYNMPQNLKLTGEVRPEDLRKALQEMTDRHEILRTQFLMIDGEPVQKILDHIDADFEYVTSEESDEELMKNFLRPFDLSSGKPVRVKLVNKGEYHLMMFDMHHIVGDGMSDEIFTREFMALYNGEKLEPLTHQFKDYSEWMRTRDLSDQAEYWKSQFEDEIPVLDMPTDFTRPQEQSYAGSITSTIIDEDLSKSVEDLVRKSGATEYMVFLAAAMVMLSKYSRQEDIVIGSPISGRTHKDTEGMLGMFVNTLAMRGRPEKNKSFKDFLKEIKETCLKAYENQEYPFEELVEAVEVQRDMSRNPLFDVMLVLQNNEIANGELSGAEAEETGSSETSAKFDLTFNVSEINGRFGIGLEYCTALFRSETADRILAHFIEVLKEITANAEQKISDIEMTTDEEKQLILNDFNATAMDYPRDKTVVELFEEQVKKTPDNTALVFENNSLTYAELNAKSNSLAHKLREFGAKPDDFVAIIADRSIEMICGIYGIIKSGGAYVPIDPTYPKDRISFMLEDCKPKAVLKYTTENVIIDNEIPVIDLGNEEVWKGASDDLQHINTPNDLIYCIYTSGTTGKPKGVLIEQKGATNLCLNFMSKSYNSSIKNVALVASYAFDASVKMIFSALTNGSTLHVISDEVKLDSELLLKYFEKNSVDLSDCTPTHLKMFTSQSERINYRLKSIFSGGENLTHELSNMAIDSGLCEKIYNVYGPTECTVDATCSVIDGITERVTIGRPIANASIYITDNSALCGIGVPGELCITGDGLARGYLNRPELTAEKFVKNPFGEGRMYRSGDLARWLPDGNIEFLGRIDEQVKIRGFRIELGEIESRIRGIDGIKDCAVIARADSTGDKAIYAYYTSDEEKSVSEIRDRLSESMPEYMVPAYMMQIEAIPVTRNGKLDKRALPDIEAKATKEYIAPRNEIEEKICNIFSEILNVEQVGIKDSFFELGGHSLRATRLVNRIEAETGTRIALKEVFAHPTAEQLAVLAGAESEEYVPIPKAEEKEYYPMSSAQKRTYLIQQMDPESTAYNMPQNLKLTGEVRPDDLRKALQEMTDRHEILRTQFLMIDGEPVQKILDHIDADFEYVTSEESDEELMKQFLRPFDLASGKPVRVKLVNKGEYHLLMFDIHHIVGDGASDEIFKREFMKLYNGEKLESLTHQFKDYSEWMRTRDLSGQAEYWKSQFEDEIPVLDMPTDFQRPQVQSHAGATVTSILDEKLSRRVKELVRKSGATEYMVFLAAAMVMLSKYSRQEDIVIGSPISGRTHKDTEVMLGMFINTLAMRGRPEKYKSFKDFLKEIKETCLKAYENQEYPFEELVEAVEVQRDMSRNPLFDVMLVLQNNETAKGELSGTEAEDTGIANVVAKFDMIFNIAEFGGKYGIGLEYCTALFREETAKQLIEHLTEVLKAVTENEDQKIGDIEAVTSDERKHILTDFNTTEAEYPRDKTAAELFEEQAAKAPEKICYVCSGRSITYGELNRRANEIAYKLRQFGVKANEFVGIITDRSVEMAVSIIAVLKSGGAYVPIDPKYPEERIRFMLEDSKPKAVIKYTHNSIEVPVGIEVIEPDKFTEGISANPKKIKNQSDLIYLIYTSGTTGKPKAVALEERGVVADIYNFKRTFVIDENVVSLQQASYSFDMFVEEFYPAICSGGRVVTAPAEIVPDVEKLHEYINKNEVTLVHCSPLLMNELNRLEELKTVKKYIVGSDKLKIEYLSNILKRDAEVWQTYGPTEGTVITTVYQIKRADEKYTKKYAGELVPIGKPKRNSKIYIMQGNSLCGIGVPGELCITGDGLARGYLNRPELTAEKFVKNPFGEGRMYRSGDLARWLPDGNIEFLGRIDEQVKIRGFRIELGEIESRIRGIDGIKDCAVIARADSTGDKAIYAYYTSDEEKSVSEIRDRLSESMPEYMVPAYMMQIKAIPVTRNGKLDKRALPEIEAKATKEYIAPRNEVEEKICNIFSEILNVEQVGIKDSFFELGGHSLRATRLVNRIEAETGTRIALKEVFAHPTAEQLAVLAGAESEEYLPIPKAEEKEYYPMSSAQKRTYLIQQMDPESTAYNMPQNLKLTGEVRPEDLRKALQEMTDRHEILRTQFLMIDGEPVQKILDHIDADFEYVTSEESDEELMKNFLRPFDLSSGKPVRVKLVNKGEYHLMMFDMHHIVGDGMSDEIFTREFMALYNGEKLEPLTHQFKDYSEWMRTRDLSDQAEYWKSQFEDEIPVLDMPTDFTRPQEQSYAGSITSTIIDEDLSKSVEDLVRKSGATEYMVFLAAAMVMLSKYSRQEDIVIGSPISGRTHKDTEGMLGMFVNTLAMRGRPEKNKSFKDFLKEIKETCLKAYENQEYPFEELVEAVEVQRDMSRNPLFDVMLVLQNNEIANGELSGAEAEETGSSETSAKFDLTFNVSEINGRFGIGLEYCTALFRSETADRILAHFIEVLKEITANAEQKISDIEMTTDEEKQLILNDFNATAMDYPRDKTVVELFEEQVKKTPDNTALVFENNSLTYAELNAKSNSLAHKLREFGAKPDDFVAIIADRSIEMICGIYGIIKSGGAYVPIDPTYPKDRISFMLDDCKPKAVLKYTTENVIIDNEIPVIDLGNEEVWKGASDDLQHINTPNDLIYCIYTSGTTGKPKGVLNRHQGIVNLISWMQEKYPLNEEDVILQKTTYVFDVSASEIFWWFKAGAKLAILKPNAEKEPEEIAAEIEQYKATVVDFVPSMLSVFMAMPDKYIEQIKGLRYVLAAGEALNAKLVKEFYAAMKKHGSKTLLGNIYGPTEAAVYSTYYDLAPEFDGETVLIGKPISNAGAYIVNGEKLCGIGVPGELCIAGDGLARGYLNRPELTAEKFVKNPFGEGRMYRSGDLARWLPDGNIEYLGRIDEQVKIRGFRIELGEIESRIREIEGIKDCAVIARADSTGDKAIYAYFTSDEEKSISEIRDKLSESMPEYMIPAYMMQIESIPVTRNGKLDKRALPDIEAKAAKEYIAPRNEIEEKICNIFSEILNVEQVGINDNFFELGGDSIKAIKIISKLRNAGYSATVKDIMNGKTADRIALNIKTESGEKHYEQDEVNGKIEPTPIMKEFQNWGLAKPNHFNQTMQINVTDFDNDSVKKAVDSLICHHDVLRAVYRNETLEILPISKSKLADYYIYDLSAEQRKAEIIFKTSTDIQKSFDLENGPFVKAAIYDMGDFKILWLCIHHLVVDGVSWRILLEDFDSAVKQASRDETIVLPEKTASFIDWSNYLRNYNAQMSVSDKEYWENAVSEIVNGKLAVKFGENSDYSALVEFDKDTTEKLMTKSSNAYGVKINEVMLAALATAVGRITGQETLSVELEGHGREELHEPILIDRTVGWFTNIYPVNLKCLQDHSKAIISAKDTIRRVPDSGIGYGFVSHSCSPDICFNYLGDFGETKSGRSEEYIFGNSVAEENIMPERISINGSISNGKLTFSICGHDSGVGKDFIEKLKDEFKRSLTELIEYCANTQNDGKTISDMIDDELDDEELELINDLFS